MSETKEHLKREVGVLGLSANLVNTVIGAGIFVLPAIVASILGAASIFAYLFCGVLVSLVMLCFAEVGSKITTSGGVYTYIQSSFGPYFGFLTMILFGISVIAADAAVANAIFDVVGSIFPVLDTGFFKVFFFLVIFGGLGYVNVKGIKQGINLVKFMTVSKLIPLLLLVLFSFSEVSFSNLAIESTPEILDIGKACLILFFAFQGAENSLSIGGEVKNPRKTIPRAVFFGVSCVLVVYILIQTVAQGVLGDSLPDFKESPLSTLAETVIGPVGFTLLTIGAAVSMFGALSSDVLSIPRVLFRASADRVLPFKALSKVHPKFATPYIAVICYASLDFIFATVGGFQQLAIISSASILLVYLGVSISVVKLRRRDKAKEKRNEFIIPGGYLVPILSSLIIMWLLSNLDKNQAIAIVIFVSFLTLIYFIKNKLSRKP
jgi:amino acid transporter